MVIVGDLPPRLADRIVVSWFGCWIWTGGKSDQGYGRVNHDGRQSFVHRVVRELLIGPIPKGHVLDHLEDVCRSRACCNPEHNEPVTNGVNVLRGDGPTARRARQTQCVHGHAFDEANTWRDKRGFRICRECHRLHAAAARRVR